jgi:hypothetical protein
MAIIEPTWETGISIRGAAAVASGATSSDAVSLKTAARRPAKIQYKVVFGGSPDDDSLLEAFNSSDDGTSVDTVPFYSIVIPWQTSFTHIDSFLTNNPHVTIKLTNNDTTDNVTFSVLYAGLYHTTT